MQTTLRIDDQLYREAKAAAREGVTITRYIEKALQLKLKQKTLPSSVASIALPTFAANGGFPFSPEELKVLEQESQVQSDRARVSLRKTTRR
jgi:antitoxin component of RelBE/YafQ-DinJ toxin-antitoxin module